MLTATCAAAADPKVAAFRADVTPALGDPLIWTTPAKVVEDPLRAKGVVLESGGERMVLCALDWCGIGNRTHLMFRRKLAAAAGARLERVTVHTIHQHTAPYVDSSAYDLLRQAGVSGNFYSDRALEAIADRVAEAVRAAVGKLQPFDQVGTSSARVERLASARRLPGPNGSVLTRFSTSGKSPAMAEAPEGDIDPLLRTVTLARGDKPLVRLHYYATHPQTFCCEGTVTSDIVGLAREKFEREEGVPQVYFTGASGDVTLGKYNDGSPEVRPELSARLLAALRASARATKFAAAKAVAWRSEPLRLPRRSEIPPLPPDANVDARYRAAIPRVFQERQEPLEMVLVKIGNVRVLHLPGEPMLLFQQYATSLGKTGFTAMAGYGDIAPGYICSDQAYAAGGYEPSASNTAPGAEAVVKAAIRKLMGTD